MTRNKLHRIAAAIALLFATHGGGLAAELINTEIDINVVASNISARGIPGSSSSTRILFWRSKKSQPALEAPVDIGVVDIAAGSRLQSSKIRINVLASGISTVGAPVRIGGVVVR
jgi:hypothetical protein